MENVNIPTGYNFRFFGYKDGQVASLVVDQSSCRTQSANQSSKEVQGGDIALPCYKAKVVLIDNDGNIKWEKQIPSKYFSGYEIRFIDEYIAVVLVKDEGTDIVIYDMEGNLVETIKSDKRFTKVIDTDSGFIVAQTECSPIPLGGTVVINPPSNVLVSPPNNSITQKNNITVEVKDNINPCCYIAGKSMYDPITKSSTQTTKELLCEENHQVYYLYRHIEPKVTTGKGKIEVVDKQKPGEPVEFVITPEKGYVLGKVKVTDVDGNVVVFTSNRFTMPTADVTIEVEFLVANANTSDIAIISISIIAILAGAMFYLQYKKFKEVK